MSPYVIGVGALQFGECFSVLPASSSYYAYALVRQCILPFESVFDDADLDPFGFDDYWEGSPGFIGSDKWSGQSPGWVFKTGPFGLGYYIDSPPQIVAEYLTQNADCITTFDYLQVEKGECVAESSASRGPVFAL